MTAAAISLRGIGKQYRIGAQRPGSDRLTESVSSLFRRPLGFRRVDDLNRIWALRDVTFDIEPGEVVGIIGRNGSGKSTLLKVLSRITEPTEGTARLRGRVGSLLEVGTGFHPELTGRENIFLSGAVLGMRRAEILRKFDEIVDFSGVERFLDTPVKRYSSGMQVRLGFAVAAHLEPEVLFVDEVLAVGDAEFQKKCLGKMSDLGDGGRTILFVSHSMAAVLRLCASAILLDAGRVVAAGNTGSVIRKYLEDDIGRTSERRWSSVDESPGDDVGRLKGVKVSPASGGIGEEINIDDDVDVEVEYWRLDPVRRPSVLVHAFNSQGVMLFATTDNSTQDWAHLESGRGVVRSSFRIPGSFLSEGLVSLNVAIVTFNPYVVHAVEHDAVAFNVIDRTDGTGVRGEFVGEWPGAVRPRFAWQVALTQGAEAHASQARNDD